MRKKKKRSWLKAPKNPLPTNSLADLAMKKLYEDEELTEEEMNALFSSEYLKTKTEESLVFEPNPLAKAISSNIILIDTQKEIVKYFSKHPEMMFSLHPRRFEELVASIFRHNGFDVELTPETRDGGIDIIAVKHDLITGKTLHLVECKRYLPENKVGIGVVQRLMGVVEMHRATQGLIVTTSDFSTDAKKCTETAKHRMSLNAYSDITNWLKSINVN